MPNGTGGGFRLAIIKGLAGRGTFEQRPGAREGTSHGNIWEVHSREQSMQV